jgi:hypothetical protein
VVDFRSWGRLRVEVEVETAGWRVEVGDEEEYARIFYGQGEEAKRSS